MTGKKTPDTTHFFSSTTGELLSLKGPSGSLQLYWNKEMVMAYLKEAASIHRRIPDLQVPGYYTLWPETMKDDWEQFYDAVNGRNRLGPPMPREITFHDRVMNWLRWVDCYEQKILWMRANNIPWKILEHELGKSKTTLWRDMNSGLVRIASMLNAHDPEGDRQK